MFILDMSSGNLCKNDQIIVKKMIDAVAKIDKKRKIILKWQLFEKAEPNLPLDLSIFDYAYCYAKEKGFKTTASVFDIKSLEFLLQYDIPFVKIANRKDLYYLIGEIPRKIKVIQSISDIKETEFEIFPNKYNGVYKLCCVSKYPAEIKDYINIFKTHLYFGVSDHTTNWDLFKRFNPELYECHFCIFHDKTIPDAGLFSHTPDQLLEVIDLIE